MHYFIYIFKIIFIIFHFFFYSSIYFHYLYWARFTHIFINHHDLLSWKYTFVTGLVCSDFQPWPVFNRRKPRIHGESNKSKTEGAWKRLYLMPPVRARRSLPRGTWNETKWRTCSAAELCRGSKMDIYLAGNVNQNVSLLPMLTENPVSKSNELLEGLKRKRLSRNEW